MLFSSLFFLQIYLPLLLILYFFVFRSLSWKNHFLLISSIIFYAWGEPKKIFLLFFSIIINYCIAIVFLRKVVLKRIRIFGITIGIIFNLLILFLCKYLIPCISFLNKNSILNISIPKVALPLGISFYTFQSISYLIDTYRNINEPQKNLEKLALFISFFPQLIAGPIIKYHDIESELTYRNSSLDEIAIGIKRFIFGLSKKVLLANSFAIVADDIFSMPLEQLDTIIAWIGAICYTMQIYYDFSGYSDMAIGLGRIFGFHFMENFNFPYCSQSIREFWRRWHISLSTWFKEYLYIPLGGNKCGKIRWNLNLLIVFIVTGIWHGAAWNFVLWGIFYGILIVLENLIIKKALERCPKFIRVCYTLFFVMIAWVLFRSDNLSFAISYSYKMLVPCNNADLHFSMFFKPAFMCLLGVGIFLSSPIYFFFPHFIDICKFSKVQYYEIPILICLLFISIILLAGETYNPFIYFRF